MITEKDVKAVILAAGKGTRMKSDLPKVLHEIFAKPLLKYVTDAVDNTGMVFEKIVITGHCSETVEGFVEKNIENAKCVLQYPQRGTGDAVMKAVPLLEDFHGTVVVLCGDTPLLTSETLKAFICAHKNSGAALTVMSARFDNPTGYGRVVKDSEGNLERITEEKDADEPVKAIKEVNAGVYCFEKDLIFPLLDELTGNNAQGEYYLTDTVELARAKGYKTCSFEIEDNSEIFGINSKEQLSRATSILNKKTIARLYESGVNIVDAENVYISPDTTIGADTTILPFVYITGKNVIGNHCKIGPFSHIRGDVKIGNNVRIGNFVEIKKSVIKDNTNVSHLSYVGDSEVGSGVNVGAGTITANYDPVLKTKSKTIIKDGANTGSNTVLVAPVEMEENSMTAAGTVLRKKAEANSLVITGTPQKAISGWVAKRKNKNGEK